MPSFKETFSFEHRQNEVRRITTKYPDRIPVIVEKHPACSTLEDLDRHKFLVPMDMTVGQFVWVLRQKISRMRPDQALFIFIKDTLPPTAALISSFCREEGLLDEDGFLYIQFSGESTFGS